MTSDELQEQLENVRIRLLEAIAPLPDDALLKKDVVGGWSIRDFLFLVTAWEAELVTALMQIDRGKEPVHLLEVLKNRQGYQAQRLAESEGRDLDQIFDDLQRVRIEVEGWLEHLGRRQLEDRQRYNWLSGRALYELIAVTSYEFEITHIPAIEAFAERAENMTQIALNSIEVADGYDDHS